MRILEYRFYQYCPCHNTGKLVLSSIFQYFHITILEYQYCQNNNTGKPVLSKQQYWKTSIVKVTILEYQYRHIYNTGIPVLSHLQYWSSSIVTFKYWHFGIVTLTILVFHYCKDHHERKQYWETSSNDYLYIHSDFLHMFYNSVLLCILIG